MMVALLLYGYAIGERSSRRLERRCVEYVATRSRTERLKEAKRRLEEEHAVECQAKRRL